MNGRPTDPVTARQVLILSLPVKSLVTHTPSRKKAQALLDSCNSTLVVDPNFPPGNQELKRMALILVLAFLRPCESPLTFPEHPLLNRSSPGLIPVNINTYVQKVPARTTVSPRYDPLGPDIPVAEEERLRKFFSEIKIGKQTEPGIVVDMFGRILIWYLPGILHPTRVVRQCGTSSLVNTTDCSPGALQ